MVIGPFWSEERYWLRFQYNANGFFAEKACVDASNPKLSQPWQAIPLANRSWMVSYEFNPDTQELTDIADGLCLKDGILYRTNFSETFNELNVSLYNPKGFLLKSRNQISKDEFLFAKNLRPQNPPFPSKDLPLTPEQKTEQDRIEKTNLELKIEEENQKWANWVKQDVRQGLNLSDLKPFIAPDIQLNLNQYSPQGQEKIIAKAQDALYELLNPSYSSFPLYLGKLETSLSDCLSSIHSKIQNWSYLTDLELNKELQSPLEKNKIFELKQAIIYALIQAERKKLLEYYEIECTPLSHPELKKTKPSIESTIKAQPAPREPTISNPQPLPSFHPPKPDEDEDLNLALALSLANTSSPQLPDATNPKPEASNSSVSRPKPNYISSNIENDTKDLTVPLESNPLNLQNIQPKTQISVNPELIMPTINPKFAPKPSLIVMSSPSKKRSNSNSFKERRFDEGSSHIQTVNNPGNKTTALPSAKALIELGSAVTTPDKIPTLSLVSTPDASIQPLSSPTKRIPETPDFINIRNAVIIAVAKYYSWSIGQQSHRGRNGFFSRLRHGKEGRIRALEFMKYFENSMTVRSAVTHINELLCHPRTRYEKHSFSCFLIDELRTLQGQPWVDLKPHKVSNRYDQTSVISHINEIMPSVSSAPSPK